MKDKNILHDIFSIIKTTKHHKEMVCNLYSNMVVKMLKKYFFITSHEENLIKSEIEELNFYPIKYLSKYHPDISLDKNLKEDFSQINKHLIEICEVGTKTKERNKLQNLIKIHAYTLGN